MACHEPEESCFCKVFGIDCAEPAADVATWMVDGELYWKALTDKGEALTKAVESLLTEADGTDAEKLETEKTAIRAIVEKLPYSDLSLEGWNGDALTEKFNSLYGKNCINHVWHVVPVPSYVRPASATISKIMTPDMV